MHACKGTYSEMALSLSAPVSLRGAYDCATWTRTATFGYPTFDGVNATIVENGSPASQAQTLVLSGNVPSSTIVDGLAMIAGAPALDATTEGVLVHGSASPVITDVEVTGGAGHSVSGYGSVALSIQGARGRRCAA